MENTNPQIDYSKAHEETFGAAADPAKDKGLPLGHRLTVMIDQPVTPLQLALKIGMFGFGSWAVHRGMDKVVDTYKERKANRLAEAANTETLRRPTRKQA